MQILLQPYDQQWPARAAYEMAQIRKILGSTVLRLEHVGSTAVVGLVAKPIIDLVLEVSNSAKEEDYLPYLLVEGYTLSIREPQWYEHRMLKGPASDIHLHVFSFGCSEATRMRQFRDWLNTHPQDLLLYQLTKQALAQRTWESVQAYADQKTTVVNLILKHSQKITPAHDRRTLLVPIADGLAVHGLNQQFGYDAYLVCKVNQEVIGEVCYRLDPSTGDAAIGVLVRAEMRGQGYGEEALRWLIERARKQTKIKRLSNYFDVSQTAALAMHLQCGFVPELSADAQFVKLIKPL